MTDDPTTGDTDAGTEADTTTTMADRARAVSKSVGRSADPMAKYEEELHDEWDAAGVDLFDWFLEMKEEAGKRPGTIRDYNAAFNQWKSHMDEQGRHPGAPSREHVNAFITYHRETVGNKVPTTVQKVHHMRRVFEWLAKRDETPFGLDDIPDFTDIVDEYDFDREAEKSPHHMLIEQVREGVHRLTHLRDRAMVVLQFKLGLRQGEVRNIQLQDLSLSDSDLTAHYPELGSSSLLRDREGNVPENAVVIPSRHERPGNKSSNSRVMPFDGETRRVLVDYLLMRPDDGEKWLFLGKTHNSHLDDEDVLNNVWRTAFSRDEWGETERYRAVTSHYGRFWFTNFWNKSGVMDREDIKYMRGDTGDGEDGLPDHEAIDAYIWRDYPDIAEKYLDHVFSLGL